MTTTAYSSIYIVHYTPCGQKLWNRSVAKALKEAEEQLPCSAKQARDWSLCGGIVGAAAGNVVGSYEDILYWIIRIVSK